MRTDYPLHDERYKQAKASGQPGCGAGNITLWLAEKGYKVYGVDIAPTAIKWAKEMASQYNIEADFQVGNVLDLKNYPDNFFDYVLDGHCFHCIIGEDRKLFLQSVYRILKPGGLFHIDHACDEVPEDMREHFDLQTRCWVVNGVALRYIGLKENIIAEVKNVGFNVLFWETTLRTARTKKTYLELDALKEFESEMSNLDSIDRRNNLFEIWNPTDVIPAKAGIQSRQYKNLWM